MTVSVSSLGFAQQASQKIDGRVIDAKTQEPLIGASVSVVNEKTGTVSDVDGNFTVHPQSFPAIISVQYLGYKTSDVTVAKAGTVTISLSENVGLLDEVVVVGYGTQRRKELTGSVVTVSQSVLDHPGTSFDAALGGAVAGLNVTQASGQPGASTSIRIRGGNSVLAGNEPLYVIDGIIYFTEKGATQAGVSGIESSLNPLASILPWV